MVYERAAGSLTASGIEITLYGEPPSWSAPTFGKNGAYDTKWKEKKDAVLLLKDLNLPKLTTPLKLVATFSLKIPTSLSNKKKLEKENHFHSGHVDLTNKVKFLEDMLQKAEIIEDDCLIAIHETKKTWSVAPRTELNLILLEDVL